MLYNCSFQYHRSASTDRQATPSTSKPSTKPSPLTCSTTAGTPAPEPHWKAIPEDKTVQRTGEMIVTLLTDNTVIIKTKYNKEVH